MSAGKFFITAPSTSTLLSMVTGGSTPGSEMRGAQRLAHQAAAVQLVGAGGQVGREAEERQPQVGDVAVAEVLGEPLAHLVAVGHGDQREGDVVERAGVDEGLADALLQLRVVPAHGHAGGDDRAHRDAADEVDRHAALVQRADRADVGVGARAAARQHQAHRLAGRAPAPAGRRRRRCRRARGTAAPAASSPPRPPSPAGAPTSAGAVRTRSTSCWACSGSTTRLRQRRRRRSSAHRRPGTAGRPGGRPAPSSRSPRPRRRRARSRGRARRWRTTRWARCSASTPTMVTR